MKNSRLTYCLAPALLLGLVFFGCKKKTEEKPPVPPPVVEENASVKIVATVNGDPITLGEFQERFARAGYKYDQETAREVKEDFLNRLIERKMMLREAQRRRIKVGLPEINKRIDAIREENGKDVKESLAGLGIDFEKWKSDLWEDMMIERLLARDVSRQVNVTPQDIRRYYQANTTEFERPEQVRARQIVVTTEEDAQKVLQSLREGHADFALIARQKSTAPEADRGGDLGYFSKGEMPAEFDVVFGLDKGELSGIVKSPYGFHIFKLEDRRKPRVMSLEEASKMISEKLSREKADQRYKQWLRELRSRTKFEVNYQALRQ
ncbi:MAG TPA: peptidyl-prolyl cis-trans isomerase [Nitrospirota bacterium]|nr:peptidyl-prolyl cis-trans isomerase [Nitrospirota bacterium]